PCKKSRPQFTKAGHAATLEIGFLLYGVQEELNAPVHRSTFRRIVVCDRVAGTATLDHQLCWSDTFACNIVGNGLSPVDRQCLVNRCRTGAVGITDGLGTKLGMLHQCACHTVQNWQKFGFQRVFARIERYMAWNIDLKCAVRHFDHVNTQAARTRLLYILFDPRPVVAGDTARHSSNARTDQSCLAAVADKCAKTRTYSGAGTGSGSGSTASTHSTHRVIYGCTSGNQGSRKHTCRHAVQLHRYVHF